MKFAITRTSNWKNDSSPCDGAKLGIDEKWYIEINSVEDIIKLFNEVGRLVIHNDIDDENVEIEIYDDWRE